jgi:hypothetical protein
MTSKKLSATTQMIIGWIEKQPVSKKHWTHLASVLMKQEKMDKAKVIVQMAEALERFHQQYKLAVVRPDNLLEDIIDTAFQEVDWHAVAKSQINLK